MNLHPYQLKKLFNIKSVYGEKLSSYSSGNVPYISGGKENYGVTGYVEPKGSDISEGGCISIDPITGLSRYQPQEFIGRGFSGASINLLYNENLNEYNSQYICSVIKHESKYKYSYGRLFNGERLENTYIKLPKKTENEPDWLYMENYVKSLKPRVDDELKSIVNVSKGDIKTIKILTQTVNSTDFENWAGTNKKNKIKHDTSKLREYKIEDLFVTYTGGDLILEKVKPGSIPVVTHSAENNSVTTFSDVIPNQKLFDSNISISLADRGCFFATIQPHDFYIGTRVKALVSKNPHITKDALIYISTIINMQKYKFSYGRNCTDNLDTLKICLPSIIDDDGSYKPDYDYMKNYIKSLPYGDKIS